MRNGRPTLVRTAAVDSQHPHDTIYTDKQACVQLPTYADHVALPAFARRWCRSAAEGPCWELYRQTDGHRTIS